MAAALLLNRAKSIVSGGGTGVLTLGADVAGFRGIAGGGISVGQLFAYVIEDGLNYEWGYATLTTSTTVTRTTIVWSSSSGSAITVNVGAIIGAGTFAEVLMNATNPVATGTVQLMAGTTTFSPLFFNSGSLTTTATGGAVEYDGSVFYATPGTIGRGVLEVEQWAVINADKTLTSTTAAQAAFNTSANGQITVGVGTYEFECMLNLASMSATSGAFGFALAGGATKTQFWNSEANKVATLATAASAQNTYNVTNANTAIVTATTATTGYMLIKGIIRVTVGGTIIPQVSLGIAAAALVKAGSYFRIKQLSGSATFTAVGNFS